MYSRTVVGRSSGSFDSLVFVLASNPAAGSGRDLFSDRLDFLDRRFPRINFQAWQKQVESSLTIVGKASLYE